MKLFHTVQKLLTGMCVYYTLLSVLLLATSLILNSGAADGIRTPSASFLFLLPCAFCISMGNQLFRSEALPRWSRILLHYLITVFSFYLFLWLPSNTAAKESTLFLTLVLFSGIYWLLFLAVMLVRNRYRRLMEKD